MAKKSQKKNKKGGNALAAAFLEAQKNGGDFAAALQSLSKKEQQNLLGAPTGAGTGNGKNQFLLGLLVGAGAAWILSDEELRGKVLRVLMKGYAQLAGGVEEIKEQMADIQAEMAQDL